MVLLRWAWFAKRKITMPIVTCGTFTCEEAYQLVGKLCDQNVSSAKNLFYKKGPYGLRVVAQNSSNESVQECLAYSSDNRTALIGRLLKKDGTQVNNLDELNIRAIKESKGRFLAEHFWGSYLLIIVEDHYVSFFRDPQSALTLFYMPIKGGYLVSSDCALLAEVLEKTPELNWRYLASYISSSHCSSGITPFKNIFEMMSGYVTTFYFNQTVIQEPFWDPIQINTSYIVDEASFQDKIYRTLESCITAWTKGSTKIGIELSGGLDSSSVLAVLKQSACGTKNVEALNLYHPEIASANEQEYARHVADLYQVPISCVDTSRQLPFEELSVERRFNKPSSFIFDTKGEKHYLSTLYLGKNDELLTGHGGDNCFLAPPPIASIVDYYLDRGLHGISSIIKDICAYYRMPYSLGIKQSIATYIQYRKGSLVYLDLEQQTVPWMTSECKDLLDPCIFRPAYWKNLKHVSPGKAQHIIMILSGLSSVERGDALGGKVPFNPLLSQPLVELALSMPTYQSFGQGYNRLHFRKAMARHMASDFMWRKSKGRTSGVIILGVRKHYSTLLSFLVDGQFARKGFLDPLQLEESLKQLRQGKTDYAWSLINLFIVEKWLNSWS